MISNPMETLAGAENTARQHLSLYIKEIQGWQEFSAEAELKKLEKRLWTPHPSLPQLWFTQRRLEGRGINFGETILVESGDLSEAKATSWKLGRGGECIYLLATSFFLLITFKPRNYLKRTAAFGVFQMYCNQWCMKQGNAYSIKRIH